MLTKDICSSLELAGCIDDLNIGGTGIVQNLRLTYNGRHYKELRSLKRWEAFRERLIGFAFGIVAGIMVAAAIFFLGF